MRGEAELLLNYADRSSVVSLGLVCSLGPAKLLLVSTAANGWFEPEAVVGAKMCFGCLTETESQLRI